MLLQKSLTAIIALTCIHVMGLTDSDVLARCKDNGIWVISLADKVTGETALLIKVTG